MRCTTSPERGTPKGTEVFSTKVFPTWTNTTVSGRSDNNPSRSYQIELLSSLVIYIHNLIPANSNGRLNYDK